MSTLQRNVDDKQINELGLMQNCELRSNYIILEKDYYYTGGGIDIGYYTILSNNKIFILHYDSSFAYGCYSISFEKALELRNTKDILLDIGVDECESFASLLSDSKIIEKYFDFIEGDCNVKFKDKDDCFKYFEIKIPSII